MGWACGSPVQTLAQRHHPLTLAPGRRPPPPRRTHIPLARRGAGAPPLSAAPQPAPDTPSCGPAPPTPGWALGRPPAAPAASAWSSRWCWRGHSSRRRGGWDRRHPWPGGSGGRALARQPRARPTPLTSPRPGISPRAAESGCSPFCRALGQSRSGHPTRQCWTLRSRWWSWTTASARRGLGCGGRIGCMRGGGGRVGALDARTCAERRGAAVARPPTPPPTHHTRTPAGAASGRGERRGRVLPDQGAGGARQAGGCCTPQCDGWVAARRRWGN